MTMILSHFPKAIADCQIRLLQVERQVRAAQAAYGRVIAKFEAEIAFDKNLTNEAQRKARRAELFNSDGHLAANSVLEILKDQHTLTEIELGRLESEFLVAQLARKGAIAFFEKHSFEIHTS